ncbi:MAG: hypothetical protein ACOVP6_07205 [Lacibacter sp.]
MDLAYSHLVPEDFNANSRVWIYQSSRPFGFGEALQLEDILNHFVQNWKSHGTPVKGFATLFFGRFIVLMADESATGVSGCSTDSSVRVIKEIETLFNVTLFDRQNLAFYINNKIEALPMSQIQYAIDQNFLEATTPYFNNLVSTKQELLDNWIIPIGNSWLKNKILLKNTIG